MGPGNTAPSMTRTPTGYIPTVFTLWAALASLACGTGGQPANEEPAGDDADDAPSLADRLHELAECEPSDAVQLVPWTGSAFDPATGELLAPLPAGHVEAVVNGWRRRDDEATALRTEYGMQTAQDVFTRDGLLGFEAIESDRCDISISHTLWRDEASMFAFVVGEAHSRAMSQASRMHEVVAGAHWEGEGRDAPPSWRDAVLRLTQERLAVLE